MKNKLIFVLIFLIVAGIGGLLVWRYQMSVTYQEAATRNLFRPYFDTVLRGDLTDAYDNFTDDYYKSEFALDDYLVAHDKTLGESGKFVGYEINTFRDCGGIFAARATVCASIILKFEHGDTKLFQYQIQKGADDQFRIRYAGKLYNKRIEGFPF